VRIHSPLINVIQARPPAGPATIASEASRSAAPQSDYRMMMDEGKDMITGQCEANGGLPDPRRGEAFWFRTCSQAHDRISRS
jgi:hypothetical protein